MKPLSFMLIAGETSGDMLAAELVASLKTRVLDTERSQTTDVQPLRTELAPRFFGAGGPRMTAAGVELAFDMTKHSVIGLSGVLKNYFKFRKLFHQLFKLAVQRQPDAIICVDFSGFNRRFAHAIKNHVRAKFDQFHPWNPKLIHYISPQVWASRPGRAFQLAEDLDLLLSIFPFEKEWYARRVPKLDVEFIGHPMIERYAMARMQPSPSIGQTPSVLLLPGSRPEELWRHLPPMLGALKLIQSKSPQVRAKMVVPNDELLQQAKAAGTPSNVDIQIGKLPEALSETTIAIASTGTVTMECALFGVPTVAMYKTSFSNYLIGKQIVTVKYLAMPNLLADDTIFPEFIQHTATPENIASAALEFLNDESKRKVVKSKLAKIIASLGGPGAGARAADQIVKLLP